MVTSAIRGCEVDPWGKSQRAFERANALMPWVQEESQHSDPRHDQELWERLKMGEE